MEEDEHAVQSYQVPGVCVNLQHCLSLLVPEKVHTPFIWQTGSPGKQEVLAKGEGEGGQKASKILGGRGSGIGPQIFLQVSFLILC